jgi:hypothetical protein
MTYVELITVLSTRTHFGVCGVTALTAVVSRSFSVSKLAMCLLYNAVT